MKLKTKFLVFLLCVTITFSGCTRLKPDQYEQYAYHGSPIVRTGQRVVPIDWLGNVFGALSKLILWNWKVERHNIQPGTRAAIDQYLNLKMDQVGDVAIQLNRYAPQDSWRRLFHNKGVKWPYRYTLGLLSVLILDTLLPGRIFGGDRYDPYTHTVHIYSDLPSIALHELGHAADFNERRYRGSYALLRILPGADLYQEHQATSLAFKYIREQELLPLEIEAYKILYPAYGTYVGGYFFGYGSIVGAIVGHIWGRSKARALE